MKALSRFKFFHCLLFAGLTLAAYFVAPSGAANAQQLIIDFRFDTNTGTNTTTFGSTTATLTPNSAGQTFTVDIWASVVPGTATASSNLGLQSLALRGVSNIIGTGAFATGAGIGPVSASFAELSPFNPPGFAQPTISDIGKTTNNGTSVTSGADGILDFGGTITAQRLTISSNTGGLIFGGGATGSANTTTTPNGWQWEVGTFRFTIGTVGATAGATTQFFPTLLTSGQGAATAGAYSVNGGTSTISGPITSGSPLTFVVGGVVTGNTSVLNMTPATATINSLAGGTNSVNLNVANTNAASAGTYTGAFGGTSAGASQSPTGTVNVPASGSVTETITYAAPATPTAVPVNFSYTITNTANAGDVQGAGANKTTAFTVDVGGATADNSNSTSTFGPALTGVIAAGGTYRGLSSMVVAASGSGGAGLAGGASLAKILGGSNGTAGNQTMSMAWRTRTQAEKAGTTFDPSLLHPTTGIISDVVNLTGIETAGTTTGPFVLDMSYNPALLPNDGATTEQRLASNKLIYLISLNPTTNLWDKAFADNENTGNMVGPLSADYGFQGTFDQYAQATFSTTTPTNAQLATKMGAWGVDITNHETWAILDHNSQFAVVPEPSTLLLAGLGLFGLVGLRRRVKKSA